MPATSACSSATDLQQFAVGTLGVAQADALARHLGQCRHCLERLHGLNVDDPLLEAIRSQASDVQRPDHPVLKQLISQLTRLRAASAGVTASAEATQAGNDGEGDVEPFDFLAPSQGPGELGRLGSFRILKVLGHGGMGVVFQAEDTHLKRAVAVKAMRPEVAKKTTARERFLREARAAAALVHDHIVAVYHVGEEGGVPYLVMPLLKGASLENFLKKKQGDQAGTPLTLGQILKLGREIAKGLAAAHAVGLIHRDIKPANIWLDATTGGRVKILDFGLARGGSDDPHLTQSGAIVGTPAYMSPEQAGGQKVDPRTDLFSLGCVLYRLCTGQLPFKGDTTMATLLSVMQDNPRPVRDINPAIPQPFSDFVMSLLAKEPAGRPASAKEVVSALQTLEAASVTAPAPRKRRRWPAIAATGLLLLVGGGLLLGQIIFGNKPVVVATVTQGGVGGEGDEGPPSPAPLPPDSRPDSLTLNLGAGVKMELVLIKKGSFSMGSPDSDKDAEPVEKPQHEVQISKDFYLGKYPVTQEQYQRMMGKNPSRFSKNGKNKKDVEGLNTDRFPVENVTWNDTQEFCKQLSSLTKRRVQLPTEAQWEYACRAGTTTRYYCGDVLDVALANFNHNVGPTTEVGHYPQNPWGLCDMMGNVYQWCADAPRTYTGSKCTDPFGAGNDHVRRGGNIIANPAQCRSAYRRFSGSPTFHQGGVGFRVIVLPLD